MFRSITPRLFSFNQKTAKFVAGGSAFALGSYLVYNNQRQFHAEKENEAIALSPEEFRDFRLKAISYYNHNTNIFKVEFPEKSQSSGLTTTSFILIKGEDENGKEAVCIFSFFFSKKHILTN